MGTRDGKPEAFRTVRRQAAGEGAPGLTIGISFSSGGEQQAQVECKGENLFSGSALCGG
jgi:hypothetical protein